MSPSPTDRIRQARRLLRSEGAKGIAARAATRAANRLSPPGASALPIDRADLLSAAKIAAGGWGLPEPLPSRPGEPLTVAWVCAPPSKGSGGHTTMFRLIAALEQAGHECIVYLDDRHGWDLDQHRATIRTWWPRVRAEVRDVAAGIDDAHAVFATSWDTAYLVLASPARGSRFYLVQDFEPYFYPRGSEYALAEDTYRFGFHCLTVGHMVADELERHIGIESVVTEFGCDTDVYFLTNPAPRRDVVFYTKPGTPRRGYDLGALALERFHQRHPDTTIHTFGSTPGDLRFPFEAHGRMSPADLNELYNTCAAGLALSFTNISLIANELLAAGTVPIVNDSPLTRADLDNPHVAWARPTPTGLADALSRVVERQAALTDVSPIAASVRGLSWAPAQKLIVEAIEHRCVDGRPAPR